MATRFPLALAPHYSLTAESVIVYQGSLQLKAVGEDTPISGHGTISFTTRPFSGYVFEFTTDILDGFSSSDDFTHLTTGDQTTARVSIIYFARSISGDAITLEVHGLIRESLTLGNSCPVDTVDFHLVDFPKAADSGVSYSEGKNSLARGTGQALDWSVIIDAVPLAEGEDGSIFSRRARITHVGRLSRADGKALDPKWADKRLKTLRVFLSLLAGRWTGPCLVVGSNEGASVWTMLDPFYIEVDDAPSVLLPGLGQAGWESLSTSLQRYETLRQDEEWDDVLQRAISWYLQSNSSKDLPTTIILAQAGLELLSWARLVQCGGLGDSFDKLPAADKIRHCLVLSGIPHKMPDTLRQRVLDSLSEGQRKEFVKRNLDGPEFFTEVRNSVVHPKPKADISNIAILDAAGTLAVHYLEYLLVNLLWYQGHIRDRTAANWATTAVPWSEAQLWPRTSASES